MTKPEDAAALARAQARPLRVDPAPAPPPIDALGELLAAADSVPDLSEARSTRALGAPITLGKQALVRALRQYTFELLAQRRAFHGALAREIAALDERLDRLEP